MPKPDFSLEGGLFLTEFNEKAVCDWLDIRGAKYSVKGNRKERWIEIRGVGSLRNGDKVYFYNGKLNIRDRESM